MSTLTIERLLEEVAAFLVSAGTEKVVMRRPIWTSVVQKQQVAPKERVYVEKVSPESRWRTATLHVLREEAGVEVSNSAQALIEAREYTQFYKLSVFTLEKVLQGNGHDARATEKLKELIKFNNGQLKNLEMRKVAGESGKVRSERAPFSPPLLPEIQKRAKAEVAVTLNRLQHIASYAPAAAIKELVGSMQGTLEKYLGVLSIVERGLRKSSEDAADLLEQKDLATLEITAIKSNLAILEALALRVTSWNELDSALSAVGEQLLAAAEETDFKDPQKVHARHAFSESIKPQLKDKQNKHNLAMRDLAKLSEEASGTRRDKLSVQPGRGGSKYEELTANFMQEVLVKTGATTLQSMGFAGAAELDLKAQQLLGKKDWFCELVAQFYFSRERSVGQAWKSIHESLKAYGLVNLYDLLDHAAKKAAEATTDDILEFMVERRVAEKTRELRTCYEKLIGQDIDAAKALQVVSLYVELEPLLNDTPINMDVVVGQLARSTRATPVTLLYLGCLRHKYPDGQHIIVSDLRDPEWYTVFEKVLKLLTKYQIPFKPVVTASDPEVTYVKRYPAGHQNVAAMEKYVQALAKKSPYGAMTITDFFVKQKVDELYRGYLTDFYAKVSAAHRASMRDAWVGWHHESVQDVIEKEWLSYARISVAMRGDANEVGYRQITKAMAEGAVFATLNEVSPLVVFATGKRASVAKELSGAKAVGKGAVGYIMLPTPDNVRVSIEDEIELEG